MYKLQVGNSLFVSGQIAMVPANLSIIQGGIQAEARLSLRHVERVLAAMSAGCTLSSIVSCVCYVTHLAFVAIAKEELVKATSNVG